MPTKRNIAMVFRGLKKKKKIKAIPVTGLGGL
jgi:hypothetical protein